MIIDQQGMIELQVFLRTGYYETELRTVFDEIYDAPRHQHDLSADRARKILLAIHNNEAKVLPFKAGPGNYGGPQLC